jgi:hypothetical protein
MFTSVSDEGANVIPAFGQAANQRIADVSGSPGDENGSRHLCRVRVQGRVGFNAALINLGCRTVRVPHPPGLCDLFSRIADAPD